MTVAEAIAELQRLPPHLPVKVALSNIWMVDDHGEPYELHLDRNDAIEADTVRYEGSHVLIESR